MPPVLRLPLFVAVSLAIAFGLGIWSVLAALAAAPGFGTIAIGGWTARPAAQTDRADPYAKAEKARAGALLLGEAEGLAFTASADDDGRPLDARCTYRLSGLTPPARFWTLYALSDSGAPLDPGPELPAALNAWTVLRKADNSFDIGVSAASQPGNWLAIRAEGRFRLALTLLDTPAAGSSRVVALTMPSILRTGCDA
ncbi:DUF1214 domain-containing protein [Ensifer soli]|uniref:DUF1214 domain-containing protein n=1 Tax=Ciceribacter sp. sgz301302 TaxID=3342379 RepID=UPI0035B82CD5